MNVFASVVSKGFTKKFFLGNSVDERALRFGAPEITRRV